MKKEIRLLIICVVIPLVLLFVVLPLYHLFRGNSDFMNMNYDSAINQYEQAKWYGNTKIKITYYEKAKNELALGDYELAINDFKNSDNYGDSNDLLEKTAMDLINNKNFNLAISAYEAISGDIKTPLYYNYAIGMNAFEKEKDYKKAIDSLNHCSSIEGVSDKIKEAYYQLGTAYFNNKDYKKAIDSLNHCSSIEGVNDKIKEAHYQLGTAYFNNKEYDKAKTEFGLSKEYGNSAYMINACVFMTASDLWRSESYESAVNVYNTLPLDFVYDGVKVNDRILCYNNYKKLKELEGFYTTISGDFHVKQIHTSTGIWNGWDSDGNTGSFNIKVTLNSDGSMNVSGTAEGWRYTNYYTLASGLETSKFSVTFNEKVYTGTLKQGVLCSYNNQTLKYLGDKKFQLTYNATDRSHDVYFNYVYTSNFVFQKK